MSLGGRLLPGGRTESPRDLDHASTPARRLLPLVGSEPFHEECASSRRTSPDLPRDRTGLVARRPRGCALCSRGLIDYKAASSERALAEIQQKGVRDHLMKFATWRCGSEAAAEDILADAMLLACDPEAKPWNPDKGSFTRHMRLVIHDLVIQGARRGYGHFERVEDGLVMDETTENPAPAADERLHDERDLARMRVLAERTIERAEPKYPYARALFELLCRGVEKPGEIAAELKRPVEEIYDTLEAFKRYGKQVRAEWEREERARMQEVRERATKKEVAR